MSQLRLKKKLEDLSFGHFRAFTVASGPKPFRELKA